MFHVCEEPDSGRTTDRIEKRKKPRTRQDLNPRPLCHEACGLPLCYNRCPSFFDLLIWKPVKTGSESTTSWSTWSHSEAFSRRTKLAKLWNVLFLDNLKTRAGQKKILPTSSPSRKKKDLGTKPENDRLVAFSLSVSLSSTFFLSFSFFSLRHFLSFQILFFLLISFSISLKKLFLNLLLFWSSHKKLWFGFSWFCFKNKVFVAGVRDWIQFLFLVLRWFVVAQKCCYLSFQGQQLFHSFYIWQSGRVLFLSI